MIEKPKPPRVERIDPLDAETVEREREQMELEKRLTKVFEGGIGGRKRFPSFTKEQLDKLISNKVLWQRIKERLFVKGTSILKPIDDKHRKLLAELDMKRAEIEKRDMKAEMDKLAAEEVAAFQKMKEIAKKDGKKAGDDFYLEQTKLIDAKEDVLRKEGAGREAAEKFHTDGYGRLSQEYVSDVNNALNTALRPLLKEPGLTLTDRQIEELLPTLPFMGESIFSDAIRAFTPEKPKTTK